ncbi:serine hydrolase domain-containing protein [Myroides injenensis]|uniref:serine hydrolase domain-containing protein n=1 Tax=Myroides injenensis TaxID=1183151 RepID=UPI0002893F96|nr:serine hydrolase domain-containing protein [Myroides injenensis]
MKYYSGVLPVLLSFSIYGGAISYAGSPLTKENNLIANSKPTVDYKEVIPPEAFKKLTSLIDQYAEKTLAKGNINSLAIAIYKDGNIYQEYYSKDSEHTEDMPSDSTLYEIASISKVFLGSLSAKAVLEGKITLTDDIRKYLKGDFSNLEFEGTPITIQNLLTHSLGFKEKAPNKLNEIYQKVRQGYYENKSFDYDMTDLLLELNTVELNKKPGTIYEYNSVGPELMAYILEQVYQKPYKELLDNFINQLHLKNTHLYEYEKYKEDLIISYDENDKVAPLLKNPLIGGSHGMISSLPDLVKFMQFYLESDDPLIKEATQLLFEDKEDGDDKGYLWDVGYGQREGHYFGKTGTSNGVQSGILMCRDSSYGMIIIMNNTSDAADDNWIELYNKIETALIVHNNL